MKNTQDDWPSVLWTIILFARACLQISLSARRSIEIEQTDVNKTRNKADNTYNNVGVRWAKIEKKIKHIPEKDLRFSRFIFSSGRGCSDTTTAEWANARLVFRKHTNGGGGGVNLIKILTAKPSSVSHNDCDVFAKLFESSEHNTHKMLVY